MTPEYAAFASQRIRLVEELLIENESRGQFETTPAMPPIIIVVVLPIGVLRTVYAGEQCYRLCPGHKMGCAPQYEYFLKSIAAESAVHQAQARKWNAEVKSYEVDTSKVGIWKALNELGGHQDNG